MKIVINVCYGGFGLSDAAEQMLRELGVDDSCYPERNDPKLVKVVEELGSKDASGEHAELKIVEIPDDVEWQIEEYDGYEHIAEKHRTWY